MLIKYIKRILFFSNCSYKYVETYIYTSTYWKHWIAW